MKQITSEELTQKLNSNKKVLVDFFAEWCGPCKTLIPVLESIQNDYDGVEFVKVNVDLNMDLALEMGVRSVPTVILFNGKEELFRTTGANSKSFYDKVITESFK